MFKIEKNIPAPPAREPRQTYSWDDLEVGWSFVVPNRSKSHMRRVADYHEAKRGWKIQVGDCPHGEGVRVWRMA